MKQLLKQLLQSIRNNQEKIKSTKRKLITMYKKISNIIDNTPDDNNKSNITSSLSQPVSNPPKKTYKRNMNNKYEIKRRHIYDWIANSRPTHFLTIQFPMNMRTHDLNVSKNHLRRFMSRFEQHIVGSKWTNRHVRFYSFAEKERYYGYTYHFHILMHCVRYDNDAIQNALDKACLDLSLSPDTYLLEDVTNYEVIYYCLKDIKIFDKTDFYDRITPSSTLFNIKW